MDIDLLKFRATAADYAIDPQKYVREYKVTFNGKVRVLRAYAGGQEGMALRALHETVARVLAEGYEPSSASFAYKKGENIVKCMQRHLEGRTFFKSDIRKFFDSITYEKFLNRLAQYPALESVEGMKEVIAACFYKGILPLGFCSSPVISDFYLCELDKKYEDSNGYVYTRYADDFIISAGEGCEMLLKEQEDKLWDDLESFGLDFNEKKTYIRKLEHDGDHFRALGLNIVRRSANRNVITVSDRYLRSTCKELAEIMSHDDAVDVDEVKGKITFIQMASAESYAKFERLVQIKIGETIEGFLKKFPNS